MTWLGTFGHKPSSQQSGKTFEVVAVSSAQMECQRDAASIDQQVSLGPQFAQVGGVRPRRFAPSGAAKSLVSAACYSQSMPRHPSYQSIIILTMASMIPERIHCWKRRWAVEPEP